MLVVNDRNRAAERVAVRSMFEARKAVFIDLLKWDLPVLAGRYEVDQFDDGRATYLIVSDVECQHLASARLLPSTEPGILSSLFPALCEVPLPSGEDVFEITRFCLSRHLSSVQRREIRNQLICGLVDHACAAGISTYTGVAELGWLQQILAFGWDCAPLGLPQRIDRRMLGAMRIDIRADTRAKLARAGISAISYGDVATKIAA